MYYNVCKNILKNKFNKNEYIFLQNDVYMYKIYYEYSIIAYYNQIYNINDEIVTILNKTSTHNQNLISSSLSNIKFYDIMLKSDKTINLTDNLTYNINNKNIKFYSSSASILKNESNNYLLNIRYVNYSINENHKYDYVDNIITLNKYVECDNSFNIIYTKLFDECHSNTLYIGVEDIRLYNDNNDIIFISNGLQTSNQIGIFTGKYDISKNMLVRSEIKSFNDNTCEKNWVYVNYKNSVHVIYQWGPLQICKIQNGKLELIETKKMPNIFNNVRGSSCGYNYMNEIWFVVHIVSYENPRYYYHMIVVLDNDLNLLRYTALFNFEKKNIEYCIGLIVENDKVIIPYSINDRECKIGFYNKSYIDNLLIYS